MSKYNFYEIIREYRGKPYPDDVNGIAENIARRLNCEALTKLLVKIRTDNPKPFGEIIVYDSQLLKVFEFEFHNGVVKSFVSTETVNDTQGMYRPTPPFTVQYRPSIQNDVTTFKRSLMENKK
jgi:hypothetical protein